MWQLAIMAAMKFSADSDAAEARKAQNERDKRQAAINNRIRGANNTREVAVANLNRYTQTAQNTLVMRKAGDTYNAAVGQQMQILTGQKMGKFERGIRAAELMGNFAAQIAMSGNTGASINQVEDTLRLSNLRQEQAITANEWEFNYKTALQIAGIMPNAAAGLDNRVVYANIDYNIDQAPVLREQSTVGMMFNSVLGAVAASNSSDLASLGQMFAQGPSSAPSISVPSGIDYSTYNAQAYPGSIFTPTTTDFLGGNYGR